MGAYPELVDAGSIPSEPGAPLQRLSHLPEIFTGISWYANHPDHYAGDASVASTEKGIRLISLSADSLAQYIAAVRADGVAPALTREFFERASQIGGH